MKYDIKLYPIEVKDKYIADNNPDFFKDESAFPKFSSAQIDYLKRKMRKFKYDIVSEENGILNFKHRAQEFGTAVLKPHVAIFQPNWNMNSIFEVGIFISELTDTEEYAKYDPQQEEWEEEDLTNL